jgi:hypothetical protein
MTKSGTIVVALFTLRSAAVAEEDPEGDDREGAVRAAVVYTVAEPVTLGFQAGHRRELGSTGPRRFMRGQPDQDLTAGLVVSYRRGNWLLLEHGGLSAVQHDGLTAGAFAVGAVGASF